jgi:predicted metalloprotease
MVINDVFTPMESVNWTVSATRNSEDLASAASGPFYCPEDHKAYLDLSFFQEMKDRFNAPGESAEAYVIAHETGHHVQNEPGILQKARAERVRSDERRSNTISVRIELQADCLAGVWAAAPDFWTAG